MVLGHSISNAENLTVATFDNSRFYLSHFLYTFHMPLFMFVAGYVLFGKKIKPLDRALRLLVPFLAWIPIYWFVNRFIRHFPWQVDFWVTLKDTLWSPGIGLWFLPTLFICSLLLIPVVLLEKRGRWWGESALAAIFLGVNLIPFDNLGLMQVKYFFFFFAAGYLSAKYLPALKRIDRKRADELLLGATVLFAALFGVLYYYGGIKPYAFPVTLFAWSSDLPGGVYLFSAPGAFLLRYLMACLGILMAVGAVRALRQTRARDALAWIGLVTMDIYVAHMLMVQLAVGSGWVKVVTGFVLAIVLSLGLSFLLLRQWWLSALVFLGIKPQPLHAVDATVPGPAVMHHEARAPRTAALDPEGLTTEPVQPPGGDTA